MAPPAGQRKTADVRVAVGCAGDRRRNGWRALGCGARASGDTAIVEEDGLMGAETLYAARRYLARGWPPIPVLPRGKKAYLDGWERLHLTEAELPQHFSNG